MLEMKLLQQEERKHKPVKAIQLPEMYLNKITIQETSKYPESCMSEPVNSNTTPDVSITMDTVNTAENENGNLFGEQVSPSPSTENISTFSMLNPAGVPILVPKFGCEYEVSPHPDERYQLLNSDERRKHRNREASRRYRERAQEDPELLRKMRDQYY